MSLNPNATPFSFNPGAAVFVPGTNSAPAANSAEAAPAAEPAGDENKHAEDKIEETPAADAADDLGEEDDEPIDENDPLWKAVLKIANGDRNAAMDMLADPDSLMVYPEVKAILEGGTGGDDAWENDVEEPSKADEPAEKETPEEDEKQPEKQEKSKLPAAETKQAEGDDDVANAGNDDPDSWADEDPREHMNLVFIGHVDAGKSTLSGNLLYLTDNVDKRTIERYEREAKQRNRESWFLAFIMDTSEEERVKGITVEVGRAYFDTPAKTYTILDAPGHKSYVPNMIQGASQADVGVLVISARRGEFETGFEKGGQTREHALLAKTLGVKFLIVAINKMDDPTVEWAVERFEECVSKLKPYLKKCGYAIRKEVRFVPISALTGANLKDEVSPDVCPWWRPMCESGANNTTDTTLLQLLDNTVLTDRDPLGGLCVPVLDRYVERGTVALGKVERGRLTVGQQLTIMPTRTPTTVSAIQIGEKWVRTAKVGENVNVKLNNVGVEDVQKGFVLCSPEALISVVLEFTAQLAIVDLPDHRPIFSAGYECMLHTHTVCTDVNVKRFVGVIENGQQKKARFAKIGSQVICVLELHETICLETFGNFAQLGRFTLRDEGKTVGIGKVTEVHPLRRK